MGEFMALITPNFNFAGQCEEAIQLYVRAFGASVGNLMRYDEATWDEQYAQWTETQKRMVYHAEVFIGEQRMMMADHMDLAFEPGISLSLVVTLDSKEDVLRAFDLLSVGGKVIYPPHSMPYSTCTTNVIDRFGFCWCVMTEN